MIDERFWWSKNVLVGSRDPKRIHIRLRTTQNLQRKLMMLRMALADREREKIQSSQNSVKMAWSQRARHKISNGTNDSSNGARMKML
jgi:hypothetical protein